MAGTKAATYSKRTPLSDLSNSSSLPARVSTRLLGVHSAENPTDHKSTGTKDVHIDSHQQQNTAILPVPDSADTVISDVITTSEIVDKKSKDPLKCMNVDNLPPKRSQRTIKPRVPVNISRTKKKVTLANHVLKYGSTHDIEC